MLILTSGLWLILNTHQCLNAMLTHGHQFLRRPSRIVLFAIPILFVRHFGGLWLHHSTDWNNLGFVGKTHYFIFRKCRRFAVSRDLWPIYLSPKWPLQRKSHSVHHYWSICEKKAGDIDITSIDNCWDSRYGLSNDTRISPPTLSFPHILGVENMTNA